MSELDKWEQISKAATSGLGVVLVSAIGLGLKIASAQPKKKEFKDIMKEHQQRMMDNWKIK